MTGQGPFDSYESAGVATAAKLVNALALQHAFGRSFEPEDAATAIRMTLSTDPTWPAVHERDVRDLRRLSTTLRHVFDDLHRGDVDAAAGRLNEMLSAHPAHPHLAKHDGTWLLHHHPADTALVPMATSICAEALARVISAGAASRLGTCAADDCDRVFLDTSKNASRRFCSTSCQNRVKAAAFRRRRGAS